MLNSEVIFKSPDETCQVSSSFHLYDLPYLAPFMPGNLLDMSGLILQLLDNFEINHELEKLSEGDLSITF